MSNKSKQNACSSSATTSPRLGCMYLVHQQDLLPIKNLERRSGASWQTVARASQNNAKKHNHIYWHEDRRARWLFFKYILATHFAFCSLLHTVTCSTELLQGIPWWLSIEPCWLFTWAKLSYLQIKYCLGSSIISLTDEVTALLTFAPPAGMIAIKLARLVRNVQKRVFKKEKDKNVTSSLGGTRWWDLLDNNSHTHKSIHSCSFVVQMLSQQKLAGLLTHRDTLK